MNCKRPKVRVKQRLVPSIQQALHKCVLLLLA